jgi:hypothetical protein
VKGLHTLQAAIFAIADTSVTSMVMLQKQVMLLYSMFSIYSMTKLLKVSLQFIAINNFGVVSHVRNLRKIHYTTPTAPVTKDLQIIL